MNREVVIIDYGMGNLWSVASAVKYLGYEPQISNDFQIISSAKLLILPGVGSFRRAMESIKSAQIDKAIYAALVNKQTKILGICLGMQLLGKSSTEDGLTEGLGLVKNEITRLQSLGTNPVKIPHIGFQRVEFNKNMHLFQNINVDSHFYFIHSYFMNTLKDDSRYATVDYGQKFAAAIESGQVFGTQFHPEKSQKAGLKLLENFLK